MKKFSINLFALVMALFTSQGIMAQDVLFQESFHDGFGQFVVEGGTDKNSSIWMYETGGPWIKASAYGFIEGPYEAYLVSPEITLGTENFASFDQKNQYFNDVVKETGLCVRLAGTTEWTKLSINRYPSGQNFMENTEPITIPSEFNGQKVQFGFQYTSPQNSSSGDLYFNNFEVKGTLGAGGGDTPAPVERKVIFEETFATTEPFGDLCGFKEETASSTSAWNNYGAGAFGTFQGGAYELTYWYLVSPEISLLTSNIVSFDYNSVTFAQENLTRDMAVSVREIGGTWEELPIPNLVITGYDVYVSSGEIVIPEKYDGKKVEIALRYASDGDWGTAGQWTVTNFVVKGAEGAAPAPAEPEVIYTDDFKEYGLEHFTQETTKGDEYTWQCFWMTKIPFVSITYAYDTDSRLVSPEMTLLSQNVVSFNYTAQEFADLANEFMISVRKVGGEWTDLSIPNLDNSGMEMAAEVAIPAEFDNSTVQIAFRFVASLGTLQILNFTVKGVKGGETPVEKVDPAIAFDVTEVAYTMGDVFTAPVLANPNNVAVTYSSSDETVATVDAAGVVTVLGEGVTTIKAMSAETDKYLAAEVSYVLTVTKAAGGEGTEAVLFEETFENGLGQFVEESADGYKGLWQYFAYYQSASADASGVFKDSRLVSPEFKLVENNKIAFTVVHYDFTDLATQFTVSIREVGGEWQELSIGSVPEYEWTPVEISVPETFNNKNVQIAFRYNSANGMVCVQKLVVKGINGSAPVEKVDPQISYEVGDVEAQLGEEFTAPVLNNPNNVEIVYSSNKPEVATVDPQTGAVTLVGEGFTTITATSVENDKYLSASVNYVLTVKAASNETVIFKESFQSGLGDFTVEGYNGDNNNIWLFSGSAKADAWGKMIDPIENYLVSPVITLATEGNLAYFDHDAMYFNDIANEIGFVIRTVGGEWTDLTISQYPSYSWVNSGKIEVPAEFNGKDVQFGFKYTAKTSASAGVWTISNFVVATTAEAPVQKQDAGLSFDVTEVEYTFGQVFEAPVLNNPNGLTVTYSSDNENVATVDAVTGQVKLVAVGVATITATSEATDLYRAGKASYTIKFTVPTGIEGITAEDLQNGKVYNLQGVRVDKLGKGVYIVNGKKVVVK